MLLELSSYWKVEKVLPVELLEVGSRSDLTMGEQVLACGCLVLGFHGWGVGRWSTLRVIDSFMVLFSGLDLQASCFVRLTNYF